MEEEDCSKTSILLDHITELQLILLAFLVEHSDINPELVVSNTRKPFLWHRQKTFNLYIIYISALASAPSRPLKTLILSPQHSKSGCAYSEQLNLVVTNRPNRDFQLPKRSVSNEIKTLVDIVLSCI